jgi:hypothetical protein
LVGTAFATIKALAGRHAVRASEATLRAMSVRRFHGPAPPLLAILLGIAAAPASAAVDTIMLRGRILSHCVLDLDSQDASINIAQGVAELQVATIGETCNNRDGYTITLSSATGGALASGGGQRAGYTVSYGDVENRPLTSPLVITRNEAHKDEINRKLKVTVPANGRTVAGDYYDVITISIAAR